MIKCKKCRKYYSKEVLVCPECGQDLKYPEGNTLGVIIAGLYFSFAVMLFVFVFDPIHLSILKFLMIPPVCVGFALSIVGIVKYPGNTFNKVVFWVGIGLEVLIVVMIVISIMICIDNTVTACVDSCNSCYAGCEGLE